MAYGSPLSSLISTATSPLVSSAAILYNLANERGINPSQVLDLQAGMLASQGINIAEALYPSDNPIAGNYRNNLNYLDILGSSGILNQSLGLFPSMEHVRTQALQAMLIKDAETKSLNDYTNYLGELDEFYDKQPQPEGLGGMSIPALNIPGFFPNAGSFPRR